MLDDFRDVATGALGPDAGAQTGARREADEAADRFLAHCARPVPPVGRPPTGRRGERPEPGGGPAASGGQPTGRDAEAERGGLTTTRGCSS